MNILQIPKNFETSYGVGAKDAESVKKPNPSDKVNTINLFMCLSFYNKISLMLIATLVNSVIHLKPKSLVLSLATDFNH